MNYASASADSKQAYEPDLQTLQTKKPFQHPLERLFYPERPVRNHPTLASISLFTASRLQLEYAALSSS